MALKTIFGDRLSQIPLWSSKPYVGNCGAGAGGIDIALAAMMIKQQRQPKRVNCDAPIDGLNAASADTQDASLNHVLVTTTGLGGQNAALILKRID